MRAAALLSLTLAACTPAPAPQAPSAPRLYADPRGLFSCSRPEGWTEGRDGASPNDNVTFTLKEGPGVFELSVYYYAPGNPYYPDAESFLRRGAKGEGATSERELPAGKAVLWSGRAAGLGTPEKSRRRRRYQAYAVLPAPKGFFALGYAAPPGAEAAHQAQFEALLTSFSLPKP